MAAMSQFKAEQGNGLLSLLPAPSPGLGLNLDIYAAVGMQSQGLLSGGRTALELANISLGIDTSQAAAHADAADADALGATPADGTQTAAHGSAILDGLLKAEGYVAPEADPYVVQTDFFAEMDAGTGASLPSAPATYYSNPGFSNPGLGGLLNSLG